MDGGERKKDNHRSWSLSSYIRIFDIDDKTQHFPFEPTVLVDLALIIHVKRIPDMPAKKRSWGICFRYMAACRYILFTASSPPIDSSSQLDLWISLPGILHHLVRIARYVHSCAFIRISRVLVSRYFVREGRRKHDQKVNPCTRLFLFLIPRPPRPLLILIMGIGDFTKRQVSFLSSYEVKSRSFGLS